MHDISPGTELMISYPCNRHILFIDRSPTIDREITVRSIRDLVIEPLSPEEFLRRPMIARGRWLVRATETRSDGKQQHRQFYLANTDQFARPGVLRLAWYNRDDPLPAKLIAREFQPTPTDRKLMMRFIHWLQSRHPPDDGLHLRILADDFRLIA